MNSLTLFIDEAGDPGVRDGLRFHGDRHEWLCLSAVLVRSSRSQEVVDWVKEMRLAANSTQAGSLHFNRITKERRTDVCQVLARKPCVAFTVASHKTNLREYFNPRLRKMISSGKFYNWCLRLLLERVTAWAEAWQLQNLGQVEPLTAVFASRGHDWDHFFAYVDKLAMQARNGTLYLRGPGLHPTTLERTSWAVQKAGDVAGCQLADTVASAFYQAANSVSPAFDIQPASALRPIVPRKRGSARDVGLTLLPFQHQAPVPSADRRIFELYGYRFV